MRRTLPFVLMFVLSGVFARDARPASIAESDHLVPVGDIIQADYYALLQRKLFVSPADFARIVDLPPGGNEVVVAIYTVQSDGHENVRITHTRCNKVLWDVGSDGQGHFVKDPSVSVKRIDAPFPKQLAVAVSQAVKRALQERRPRPPPRDTDTVIVDGSLVEFSVSSSPRQTTRGVLTPDARGTRAHRLHHLKDLLQRYCQRPATERPAIALQIASEAAKIACVRSQRPNQAMERTPNAFASSPRRVRPLADRAADRFTPPF
jgi:hypothetical protein